MTMTPSHALALALLQRDAACCITYVVGLKCVMLSIQAHNQSDAVGRSYHIYGYSNIRNFMGVRVYRNVVEDSEEV